MGARGGAFAPNVDYVVVAPTVVGEAATVSTVDAAPQLTTAAIPAANAAGWNSDPVTVTGTATDERDTAPVVEYQLDDGSWATATGGLQVTTDGQHVVRVRATDAAGHVSDVSEVAVQIDETAPTVALSADRTARTVTAVTTDGGCGLAGTESSVDGGVTWQAYTGPVTISSNRAHVVDHRLLRSNVVVAGSEGQVPVKIDAARPSVSASVNPSGGRGTPRNPVEVVFTGVDTLSGLASTEYRVGNGPWTAAPAGGVRFDTVGDVLVSYRSTDVAGNTSAVRSTTIRITADVTPAVRVLSSRVAVNGYLTVTLAGFDRYDAVAVTLGQVTVGTVTTGVDGTARYTFRVPADTPAGPTGVTATGSDGDPTATGQVTVTR